MITRAKISAVRASGCGAYSRAALIRGRRLLTFLSQLRRLFEGGAYSSKYGKPISVTMTEVEIIQVWQRPCDGVYSDRLFQSICGCEDDIHQE